MSYQISSQTSNDTSKRVVIAVIDRHYLNLIMVEQKESLKWGLPKGHLEKNENAWAGAIRELMEETNLSLKKVKHRIISKKRLIYIVQLLEDFHELQPDLKEISQVGWRLISDIRADSCLRPDKYNMWLKIFFIKRFDENHQNAKKLIR